MNRVVLYFCFFHIGNFFIFCDELTNISYMLPYQYIEGYDYIPKTVTDDFETWEEEHLRVKRTPPCIPMAKKPWTIIVYMAADNDLRPYAALNLEQIAKIGSNKNVNFLVHLDIKLSPKQKITRHYYIVNQEVIYQMNTNDPHTQAMDSGNPNTLVAACNWAATDFPAEKYALILWNHGTGCLDPARYKINKSNLFIFNSITNLFEVDRSTSFIELIEQQHRGVCWDDTTGNFLTNQKLNDALAYICTHIIRKQFSLIGFDACLMSMVEVADLLHPYAEVMVGSQEVEMGAGWDYSRAFASFTHTASSNLNSFDLADTIVKAYEDTYSTITGDFTLSAINLLEFHAITANIQKISDLLAQCIQSQDRSNHIRMTIKTCASAPFCTFFAEPTYVDLYHFYRNLRDNTKFFKFKTHDANAATLITRLNNELEGGLLLIDTIVFANAKGKNLKDARGLSIYFPKRAIHPSYTNTNFAKRNNWLKLMKLCLQ